MKRRLKGVHALCVYTLGVLVLTDLAAAAFVTGCTHPLEPVGGDDVLKILWHRSKDAYLEEKRWNKNFFDEVWSVVDEFEAANGKRVMVTVTGDMAGHLIGMTARKERMDLAWMNRDFILPYLNTRSIQDIRPWVNSKEEPFYPGVSRFYSADGAEYAAGSLMNPLLLVYNKTLFTNRGKTTPTQYYEGGNWTLENFKTAAKEMTYDQSGDHWGFDWGDMDYMAFMAMNGVSMLELTNIHNPSEGFQIKANYASDPAKNALEALWTMYRTDKSIENDGPDDPDTAYDLFKAQKVAMTLAYDTAGFSGMTAEIEAVPLPQGPDTEWFSGLAGAPQGFCIPATCYNPQAAAAFMKLSMRRYLEHERNIYHNSAEIILRQEAARKSLPWFLDPAFAYFIPDYAFNEVHALMRNGIRSAADTGAIGDLCESAVSTIRLVNPRRF
jgi:maltose-binding protein MalE